MLRLVLIVHDLRSAHNVGSLLRTAEGLGIEQVYLTGYTPYPTMPSDTRLPHEQRRVTSKIHKTALGAENTVAWTFETSLNSVIDSLKSDGWYLAALEQSTGSEVLHEFKRPEKTALIVGNEVKGLEPDIVAKCDTVLEIPMRGFKESFNVAAAAAMALYHLAYSN